jgi:hypothetical protein
VDLPARLFQRLEKPQTLNVIHVEMGQQDIHAGDVGLHGRA